MWNLQPMESFYQAYELLYRLHVPALTCSAGSTGGQVQGATARLHPIPLMPHSTESSVGPRGFVHSKPQGWHMLRMAGRAGLLQLLHTTKGQHRVYIPCSAPQDSEVACRAGQWGAAWIQHALSQDLLCIWPRGGYHRYTLPATCSLDPILHAAQDLGHRMHTAPQTELYPLPPMLPQHHVQPRCHSHSTGLVLVRPTDWLRDVHLVHGTGYIWHPCFNQ